MSSPIGWKLSNAYPHVTPTAPYATPPSMSFSDAPTVAMGRKSVSSSGIPTPKSPGQCPMPQICIIDYLIYISLQPR